MLNKPNIIMIRVTTLTHFASEMPRLLTVFLCEPHALELVGLVLRLLLEAARPRRKLVLLLAALAPRVERHLAHLKIGIHCTFSRTVSNF